MRYAYESWLKSSSRICTRAASLRLGQSASQNISFMGHSVRIRPEASGPPSNFSGDPKHVGVLKILIADSPPRPGIERNDLQTRLCRHRLEVGLLIGDAKIRFFERLYKRTVP